MGSGVHERTSGLPDECGAASGAVRGDRPPHGQMLTARRTAKDWNVLADFDSQKVFNGYELDRPRWRRRRCKRSNSPMIALRRANQRLHDQHRQQQTWHTFFAQDQAVPFAGGFGTLEVLNEHLLSPGAALPWHSHQDEEIVTYVYAGALAHGDSMGRSGVIRAGEFQCRTGRRGTLSGGANALQSEWAHSFRIGFRLAGNGTQPSLEQKRFGAAQRRGGLCIVASPDGRRGSLRLHQDALVYSAMLVSGQHLVHELVPRRSAWLHVVRGRVALADLVLSTGDGVGVSAERGVSLTSQLETELLLVDIGEQLPRTDVY